MTGFTLLSKSRDLKKHNEAKAVDIVGIHSISGSSDDTWKTEDGSFWLDDFLPRDFKHARVFSFGFEPLDVLSDPSKNFGYIAGDLFNSILDARNDIPPTRPLILLCDGLGALLIDGVLLRAKLDVLINGHNVALSPEILKILPKAKSNWCLGCFTNREEDDYKYLVKDIKKVVKARAKYTGTETEISNPQQQEEIPLNLSPLDRTLQHQPNSDPKIETGAPDQTLADVSFSPSKKHPRPFQTGLTPVVTFSASVRDNPFFYQTNNRQENAKASRSDSAPGNTSSLNGTANYHPQRSFSHASGFPLPGGAPTRVSQYPTPTYIPETTTSRRQTIPQQHNTERMAPTYQTYHPPTSTPAAGQYQNEPASIPYLPHNPFTSDAHHTHRKDVPPQALHNLPYRPYDSARASDARNGNFQKANQLDAVYQHPRHTSQSFNPNPWNPRSSHIPPPSARNPSHRSSVRGTVPPIPGVGSTYPSSGLGSANGPMGHRPASHSIGIQPSYPQNPHPYPHPHQMRGSGTHSNQFPPPPGIGASGLSPTQFNVPPMFSPSGHAPPQGRNMGPSANVAPPKPERTPKMHKSTATTKESKTSKSSKFPKDKKTRKGGERPTLFDELSAPEALKARTTLQEHGFLGVSKTQYNAGLSISTPIAKALGKEQRHTHSRKSSHTSRKLDGGDGKESLEKAHKGHSHRSHKDASKSQSGHKDIGNAYPKKSQKDHSHSAKSHSLRSHARRAHSHAHNSHEKHGRKHRQGSVSESSSSSDASNESDDSSGSENSSSEKEPSRSRNDSGFDSNSASEESDYEEPTANPNENVISERTHGDKNPKANGPSNGAGGTQEKQSRDSYDSGNDSALDDNGSISDVSIASEAGMDCELEIDAYD